MAEAALLLGGGSALLGAGQTVSAGRIRKLESETEAKQIQTAAAAREADRREDLARAASSQVAASGAGGVLFSGSPMAVLNEDIRRADEASQRDTLQSKLAADAAKVKGKVAYKQAVGKAITGLLKTAGTMAAASAGPSGGVNMQGQSLPQTGNTAFVKNM